MTPAQEAKEFAAAHGFAITPNGRRYIISHPSAPHGWLGCDVGGYPAALNAMKRWVNEHKSEVVNASFTDAAGRYVVARIERGEMEKAREAGADVKVVPGWDKVDTSTELLDVSGATFGTLGNDSQCAESVADAADIGEVPIAVGAVFDTLVYTQQYGRAKRPKIDEAATRAPDRGPGPQWRVWQRQSVGIWVPLGPFANRSDAVAYCRRLANIRSLHNLAREIRYEV